MQDVPPPAASAPAVPAPDAAPVLQRLATVAQRPKTIGVTKGGRSENAVVRHQIFLKTVAQSRPVASVEGVTISAIPCAWSVEAYLQREICFYSMTGLLACTDAVSKPIAATDAGQEDLPVEKICAVQAKPVDEAENRVIAVIDRISAQVFDEDFKLVIKPQLTASGATVTER